MSLDRIPQRTDKAGLVHQREHGFGLCRRDDLGFHTQCATGCVHIAQEVHPLFGIGHHHAAGQVQAAGLAGDFFQLLVQGDGVGLQLGYVRVTIEGVEAAGRVPR